MQELPKGDAKLDKLLKIAASRKMTAAEIWEQRISFVYGQLMDCAPHITRDEIELRAIETYGPKPVD